MGRMKIEIESEGEAQGKQTTVIFEVDVSPGGGHVRLIENGVLVVGYSPNLLEWGRCVALNTAFRNRIVADVDRALNVALGTKEEGKPALEI